MSGRLRRLLTLALAVAVLDGTAAAQSVTRVRAVQLPDRTVEVLYDLSGAGAEGATVSVVFSGDGGGTYDIVPAASAVSGHVGTGVWDGADRRIVWNAAATLPAESYRTTYRAAVTATNPPIDGREVTFTLPGGVPLVMIGVRAGSFQMGSPTTERGRSDDETLHTVTLTKDYYVGKYEVTQAQWQAVMGSNPSHFSSSGGGCPVEQVSWDDIRGADGFLARLNRLLGTTKFRLPTEAEWERAARAGTQTRFSFGDALDGDDACGTNAAADAFAWWCGNAGSATREAGAKDRNAFGLFDMHGNTCEWVEDWQGSSPSTPQTDPTGPEKGTRRVLRGGSWVHDLRMARSAYRFGSLPHGRYSFVGFRLARTP
jgi:formylglycine-generating enzyme required for sulfatase activity